MDSFQCDRPGVKENVMLNNPFQSCRDAFQKDYGVFWNSLSRMNNLLVIMNISMFFLTGLVAQGYYYTFFSLFCLGVVGIGILIPTALIRKVWYYWVFLVIELVGFYYLVNSIVYWVRHS